MLQIGIIIVVWELFKYIISKIFDKIINDD
jgi:hypothetical protein